MQLLAPLFEPVGTLQSRRIASAATGFGLRTFHPTEGASTKSRAATAFDWNRELVNDETIESLDEFATVGLADPISLFTLVSSYWNGVADAPFLHDELGALAPVGAWPPARFPAK